MDRKSCKERILCAVEKLNKMDNNVLFRVVETAYSIELDCVSRNPRGRSRWGSFECLEFFEDYKDPVNAYVVVMNFAEVIVAASRLNDPTAYHNAKS